MTRLCAKLPVLALLALFATTAFAGTREELLAQAVASWNLADGGKGAAIPLAASGDVKLDVLAEGDGAIAGSACARLSNAYFDAGKTVAVKGNQITVYLRARDPRGQWTHALFAKRGGHNIVTFNLFSVDLPDTPGPDIGFEIHTDAGFMMVSFPVSQIAASAWHDLAGRYDGKTIELLCDGKVMAKKPFKGGNLTQNNEPVLIGAESDNGRVTRPFTGEMQEAALFARALTDAELALLMRKEKIVSDIQVAEPFHSPIHYRPEVGALADTIPFFWKGEYHIFYLRANIGKVPWEHLVSTDVIHWKELPTALVADGDPAGPDGENMFTGSVTEKDGTFHIFYTGNNGRNKQGFETVMHATSPDLIKWTKHPEQGFRGDGVMYKNADFRDPYVFWNEKDKLHWMILCTRDAKTGKPVQGVAQSPDLVTWKQVEPLVYEPPLGGGTPECPDLFQIGDTWYMIYSPSANTTDIRFSKDIRGPYRPAPSPCIDTPILYAAKRMADGKRHIITGWIRDLNGDRDNGGFRWGGTQSLPREVYAGADGQLLFRPVPEATAVFTRTALDLAAKPAFGSSAAARWAADDGTLTGVAGANAGSQCTFDVPDNYMLQCKVQLDAQAKFSLAMREQDRDGAAYRLTLRPGMQEAEISSPAFRFPRKIAVDATQPITIQAFVQGNIIECFIGDAFAFSCRAYDYRKGKLGLNVSGGKVKVLDLTVKTE